ILFRNVLRNSMSSIMTIVALAVGTLMGGSVVVESIFNWPGVGKLAMDAISARDYPVIQGFVLVMAVIYVLINLFTDLFHHWLDPRIELE
ncbi:MAG: ABC transporter permease, partial [Acutalibacteraceae bacterium]|nr:ABC transporter permease [Acutalibacteraceae bacterium]